MSFEFKDCRAVVTGASSGIGLAVTERLLHLGVQVLTMSRNRGDLARLQDSFGDQLHWMSGDVTHQDDLSRLSHYAQGMGPIDFLVPNAGIVELADSLDSASFDRQWAVNGAGALNTFAALRQQMAKPAAVVFIGTFLSRITFPGLAAYIASKSALTASARTLAVEQAPQQIRVNIVAPGPTATPIWSKLGLSEENLQSVAASVSLRLLRGKFIDADAVADVIVFLLSDAARSIYGQELVVDDGYTLR